MLIRKRLWWTVSFVAVVTLLVVLTILPASPGYSTRPQRLADGSSLKIVSMSYGQTHSYALPGPKKWQQSLAARLPSFVTDRLGWLGNVGRVGGSARPGELYLAIFTLCEQESPTRFWRAPQLVVLDESGHQFGEARMSAYAQNGSTTRRQQLALWPVYDFPLNAKRLVLRFSALGSDGTTQQPVAEFIVANPALTNTIQGQKAKGEIRSFAGSQ